MCMYYEPADVKHMAEKQLAEEDKAGKPRTETAQERATRIWKLVEDTARGT